MKTLRKNNFFSKDTEHLQVVFLFDFCFFTHLSLNFDLTCQPLF